MLKNYFKTAWRNLWKNKFYSAINISGLSAGLAVGIMILLWVQHETSYDSFHSKAADIYKINSHLGSSSGAQVWEGAPAPLALFSKQSIPEVVRAVKVKDRYEHINFTYADSKFTETSSAFIDPSFFSVFDFPLLSGDPAAPFKDDHSIILSLSAAKKYFGNAPAEGKVLVADNQPFTVTGVVKDFPDNSRFRYDVLFPMSLFARNFGGNGSWKTIDEDLGNYQYNIYLQLQEKASPELVAKKITKLFVDKKGEDAKDNFFTLQPLKTLHLVMADGNSSARQMVSIFMVVAILILLIACINYVNLSTARSMLRSKEVSMRKITGASRAQLFVQFITESAVLFIFATLLAMVLIYLLMPLYNNISGKHLVFDVKNTNVWLVAGCTVAGTLLLSGIYPALLLSSFRPLQAMKGKLSLGIGATSFRKVLVVTQFTFSIILITGTIVITRQLHYLKSKDPGYNKEHVFSIALTDNVHKHLEAVRNELLKESAVSAVSSSDGSIIGENGTTGDAYWEGKPAGSSFLIHANGIDSHFIPLLDMKMAAGANFTGTPSDSAHFILNETAIRQSGIKDPIGKTFQLWQTKGIITGVVKDYNYASLKKAIEPTIFYYGAANWLLFVKTKSGDASRAIAAAEDTWKKYAAETPFQYSFLDEDYNKLYQSEEKTATLFNVFATVAILISCLGLFGLITFIAHLKTKEIGIRKILGASIGSITTLMTKDFIALVLVAFVIAAPVAWYAMNSWLEDYTYRISLGWEIFGSAGLLAVAIALLTVSFQAIKAAMANPVKSLRTE